MSENDINANGGNFSAEDTKTRKTVRLHPAGGTPNLIEKEKIADPLSGRDTDTSNLEILDDTQTRRTVKIKPIAPPAGGAVKLAVDPADTRTRKTVVLRPVVEGSAENTNTRKTVVLRPQAAGTAPAVPAAEAKAETVELSDETVAVPKPQNEPAPAIKLSAPAAPAAAPAAEKPAEITAPEETKAEKVELSDETVAVAKPKLEPQTPVAIGQPAAEDDDQTVKIKRPAMPPRIGPRPMVLPWANPAWSVPEHRLQQHQLQLRQQLRQHLSPLLKLTAIKKR